MKKQIENIFSTEKEQPKEPPNKFPIIIDTREKQSLVFSFLVSKNANAKFEKLDIGDYLIGETIIERKTATDFHSSILDKRLLNQLLEMKKYPNQLLIIEKYQNLFLDTKIHENAIRGMLYSILFDFQIPIIFTENEEDTAKNLISIAKRLEKEKKELSLRFKKTEMTFEEQKQFILEGFPGIGPTTSKKLLEKYKTLNKIFSQKQKELEKIDSIDEKKAETFKKLLEK